MRKFGEYTFFIYDYEIEAGETPEHLFINDFNEWVDLTSNNICQLYNAFMSDYNPLENYDMILETVNGTKVATLETRTEPERDKIVSTNYQATYDSGTTETEKNETTTTATETRTKYITDVSTTFEGETTENYTTVNKTVERKHGNLGVASVPDQIEKELRVRFKNNIYTLIDTIINDMCVLIDTGD